MLFIGLVRSKSSRLVDGPLGLMGNNIILSCDWQTPAGRAILPLIDSPLQGLSDARLLPAFHLFMKYWYCLLSPLRDEEIRLDGKECLGMLENVFCLLICFSPAGPLATKQHLHLLPGHVLISSLLPPKQSGPGTTVSFIYDSSLHVNEESSKIQVWDVLSYVWFCRFVCW